MRQPTRPPIPLGAIIPKICSTLRRTWTHAYSLMASRSDKSPIRVQVDPRLLKSIALVGGPTAELSRRERHNEPRKSQAPVARSGRLQRNVGPHSDSDGLSCEIE